MVFAKKKSQLFLSTVYKNCSALTQLMTMREDLSGEQHIAFFDPDPLLAIISVFLVSKNLKVSFEKLRNGDEKKKNPFSFLTPLKASTHLKSACPVYVTPAISLTQGTRQ